jgi:HEAT repeat protein
MEKIRPFLSDSNLKIKQAAILSFGMRLSDFPETVDYLTPGLKDANPQIRSTTISALGMNIDKFPQLKQPFLDIAQDNSQPVEFRQNAMLSLSKIDAPEIKNFFVDDLKHPDWQIRQAATLGLSNFKAPEIPELLKPLTQDSSWQVRQASAFSLGNFDQPQTIDYLKPLLNDNYWQVRQSAVNSLGNFNNPQIIDPVIPKLSDPSWQVRQSAVTSLGKMDDSRIADVLMPRLSDTNSLVRQTTALSLGGRLQAFPQLVDPFIKTMKIETDPFTRHITASALSGLPAEPRLALESKLIQDSLIPGLRVEGWTKQELPLPETGVRIGYKPIESTFGSIWHTFVSVTYGGETRTIGFDAKQKDFNLLFSTPGYYRDEFENKSERQAWKGEPIMYSTLTTDPVAAKRLFDIIPNFYNKPESYNLFNDFSFGINCFGGRNKVLQSAGILTKIPDTPFTPLEKNYGYFRSASFSFSDPYSSYSIRIQQSITYSSLGVRSLEITTSTHYESLPQISTNPSLGSGNQFNYPSYWQSPMFNYWNNQSFPLIPSGNRLNNPNFQSVPRMRQNFNPGFQWP